MGKTVSSSVIHYTACCALLLGFCLLGALYYVTHNTIVPLFIPQAFAAQESILLDDEGIEWARLQRDQREHVPLTQLPRHLINAFIATEDRQFYQHSGISWYGIIRSIVYNLRYRRFMQGASTITQQLVRLLLGDTQKTVQRKIKEQLIALMVEQHYSKDQILEMYLNNLYFGCGIYGIKAAAQRFWNKQPDELTLDESAVLAGIVKNPHKYCPLTQVLNALQRRNVVLSCMVHAGFIDESTMHRLQELPLTTVQSDTATCCAPHARDAIQQQLETVLGRHQLYRGGLTIKTTLNRTMQHHAQLCFKASLEKLRATKTINKKINGALVCLQTDTGEIKALIGGYDYATSQFNRATQAHRQLGSIFKPLVYASALEKGMPLSRVEYDEPLSIPDRGTLWEPGNVTKKFDGPMTTARALVNSNNIIAIKTVLAAGVDTVFFHAQQCGLPVKNPYLSLALGCIDATPCEAAGMFNIFANKGVYQEPHLVQWVKDPSETIVWQATPRTQTVLSWATCSTIMHLLEQAVKHVTNYLHHEPLRCAAAGKTGTTNKAQNCWFAGSTPQYTTVVYLGADDHTPLGRIFATTSAFPLWLSFNKSINQPILNFTYDPQLEEISIDPLTGDRLEQPTAHSLALLHKKD